MNMTNIENNFFKKYLKYKNKYVNLRDYFKVKNQIGSGEDDFYGINFEGGKIISHILSCSNSNCIGWANCQIVMDAPYNLRVADESVRKLGRSEIAFGMDEEKFNENIKKIFTFINNKYPDIKIIIQIARGRSAEKMFLETLKPIFDNLELKEYEVKYGYTTDVYYDCTKISAEQFIFVNIGMFAILTNSDKVDVGTICNPIKTWSIEAYKNNKFEIKDDPVDWSKDERNILLNPEFKEMTQIKLFGIADYMKFITPDIYHIDAINELVKLE